MADGTVTRGKREPLVPEYYEAKTLERVPVLVERPETPPGTTLKLSDVLQDQDGVPPGTYSETQLRAIRTMWPEGSERRRYDLVPANELKGRAAKRYREFVDIERDQAVDALVKFGAFGLGLPLLVSAAGAALFWAARALWE